MLKLLERDMIPYISVKESLMLEFLGMHFIEEVSSYLKSIIDYKPNTNLAKFLASFNAVLQKYGSKNVLFFAYRASAFNYVYHLQINSLSNMRIVSDVELLSTEVCNDLVSLVIDLYAAILEIRDVKLDNQAVEMQKLSALLNEILYSEEAARQLATIAGATFYEKLQAVAKILENNDRPHVLRDSLRTEKFMRLFYEHGLITDNIESVRFKKLFHRLCLALFNLSRFINVRALFTVMSNNSSGEFRYVPEGIENLRAKHTTFIMDWVADSQKYLANQGCKDLLEKNDSSTLLDLKDTNGIEFFGELIHAVFLTLDKEKSAALYNSINLITDPTLKSVLLFRYQAIFKDPEANLESSSVWQSLLPTYLMSKDRQVPTLGAISGQQHTQDHSDELSVKSKSELRLLAKNN